MGKLAFLAFLPTFFILHCPTSEKMANKNRLKAIQRDVNKILSAGFYLGGYEAGEINTISLGKNISIYQNQNIKNTKYNTDYYKKQVRAKVIEKIQAIKNRDFSNISEKELFSYEKNFDQLPTEKKAKKYQTEKPFKDIVIKEDNKGDSKTISFFRWLWQNAVGYLISLAKQKGCKDVTVIIVGLVAISEKDLPSKNTDINRYEREKRDGKSNYTATATLSGCTIFVNF